MARIRACLGVLIIVLSLCVPAHAEARGRGAVLSEREYALTFDFPADFILRSEEFGQLSGALDGTRVTLVIRNKPDARDDDQVIAKKGMTYVGPESIREDLPDCVASMGTFQVSRLSVPAEDLVELTAVCALGDRYQYIIILQGYGDLDVETLALFTSPDVAKTPYHLPPGGLLLVVVVGLFGPGGLLLIVLNIRKSRVWPRATGVITDFERHIRSGRVFVSFRAADGTEITGQEKTRFSFLFRAPEIGKKIAISYCARKPRRVHIRRIADGYVSGVFFLVFAGVFAYLLVQIL